MILTERDKNILRWVEEHKSITINQTSKIFFKHCKESYYQARKRLRLLSNNGYLKRYRADMKSECIYYLDKKLSIHDLKVLDVYAEFISYGAEIRYFKKEYIIDSGSKNYRLDALIEVLYNDYFYPIIIEVDYTHLTGSKKLQDIYNSNHFQVKYKNLDDNIFPYVVIIRPVVTADHEQVNNIDILHTDFSLKNLSQVFN